jgi:hypothetical protein
MARWWSIWRAEPVAVLEGRTAEPLTTPRSTGPCDGQIGRVKLIKRVGFGCAKLDLLAQRILHRMVAPRPFEGNERQNADEPENCAGHKLLFLHI